ncbi:uncharacterized protein LOC129746542 [Uranotaenia lowii]|uniref:uncharacterized protein LOC129746542 n=1 Tax=Uranotaenia lowii TaxID=190385 RepID=UPI0024791131|nr:uncharacterized protein LOC129746542 [Uranotaenia lowii]
MSMSSTEYNVGLGEGKCSSRVLKPPGGGHSDIFGSPEVKANPPRPKYNQQNSSNLNACMGTTDPNQKVDGVEQNFVPEDSGNGAAPAAAKAASSSSGTAAQSNAQQDSGRARVPPGGFSAGFW